MASRRAKHINSRPDEIWRAIQDVEKKMRQMNIVVTYPTQGHDDTPMLGHTKGNTKSNRKKTKKHQEQELLRILLHLERQLPDGGSDGESEDEILEGETLKE